MKKILIAFALIASSLALPAPPCRAQNQSVTYAASFEPGQPHELELWSAQPGQDPTQDPALTVTVPVSPFGAQTQAVRVFAVFNGTQRFGGIENGGAIPLFGYHAQTSCMALLRTAPTRRVGPQPIDTYGFTYIGGGSSLNVASFDGLWNNAGTSGAPLANTACTLNELVTLTRTEHPVTVARFCVSHPGDPGRVHLQLVPQGPVGSWFATGPNGEPRGPTNYGHAWWTGQMKLEDLSIFVVYFNFVPTS